MRHLRFTRRFITTLLLMLALIGSPGAHRAAETLASRALPACGFEDGSGGPTPCYWNAKVRGNKQGLSFWVSSPGSFHYFR